MNDESRPLERPRQLHPPTPYHRGRRPPEVHVVLGLEELPVVRVIAGSLEDEIRLRRWLANAVARRRLLDAVLDGLDEIAA